MQTHTQVPIMRKTLVKVLLITLVASLPSINGFGRSYQSILKDKATGKAVEAATVLLLDSDSTSIAVTVSDDTGAFAIEGDQALWLLVNHLMYQSLRVELSGALPDTLYLEPKTEFLDEIVVRSDRPVMKLLEGGVPSYDIDALFGESTVTTAYEMLSKLPGMGMQNGELTLVGTPGFTLVMNGKPSDIPRTQLLELLKTIPVQMVASVEISYAPIARYRAKGASVNVVLKQQPHERGASNLAGQLYGTYANRYYSTYEAGGSISYSSGSGFSMRGSYTGEKSTSYNDMTFDTAPFGTNTGFHINNKGKSTLRSHTAFLDLGYAQEKHRVSVGYYGTFHPDTRFAEQNKRSTDPLDRIQRSISNTHHASLEYTYDEHLMLGAFYTHYDEHKDVAYGVERDPLPGRAFSYYTSQRSQVFGAHIDDSRTLGQGWRVEYGSKFSHSRTVNAQQYTIAEGAEVSADPSERTAREFLADVYVGVGKQISPKLSAKATLIGDYAKYYGREEKVQLIPQVNLTYILFAGNMLQLSLASEKSYPAYFEREPFTTIHSEYQQWKGNPDLRPFVSYRAQLLYVLRGQYIFILGNTYTPGHFKQLMYLDPKINQIVYKTWNWDYHNLLNATAVLPLPKTDRWQGKLTLNGQLNSVRTEVPYAETLERHKPMLYAGLDNEFTLSERYHLTAGADLGYVTGGIQGYYSFSDMVMLNLRAKWVSSDKKWSVTLRGDDLLNKATPKIRVDYGIHRFDFSPSSFNRRVSLDIRYTFGSFKSEKKPAQLKTDRFGM